MEATIVKNDDFQTVGFEIKGKDGNREFYWGITPNSLYYTKSIKLTEEQFAKFIRLSTQLNELKKFQSRFFSIIRINESVSALDTAFNFQDIVRDIENLEKRLELMINSLK